MDAFFVLGFLNLGLPEAIVIGIVALLLFGPRAARAMGRLGRTLLDLKKEVDDTKDGIQRQIKREINATIHGKSKEEDGPARGRQE